MTAPKNKFSSNDFAFRPTAMSAAMAKVGLRKSAHFVREPLVEANGHVIHVKA